MTSSKLKQARIDSGYSIEEVSHQLKIRKQYLIAIEEGRFEDLPGKVYVDGYVKSYAKYLGIVVEPVPTIGVEQIHIPENNLRQRAIQKYLIIIAILMLIVIGIVYHLIYQVTEDDEGVSTTFEYSTEKNLNYSNEPKE